MINDPLARGVELVSATGEVVPLELQHAPSSPWLYWLVPATPLQAGQLYRASYPRVCNDSRSSRLTHTFSVVAAAPRPQTIGSIAGIETAPEVLDGTDGVCSDHLDVVTARLNIAVASELQPFLPATRIIAKVDGQVWRTLTPDAASDHVTLPLTAACDGRQGFLTQGEHDVELTAEVSGQVESLPALRAHIDLDCSDGMSCAISPQRDRPRGLLLSAALVAIALWHVRRRQSMGSRSERRGRLGASHGTIASASTSTRTSGWNSDATPISALAGGQAPLIQRSRTPRITGSSSGE